MFKQKQNINSNIKKYKTYWVVRVFKQCEGIDYFKTFAAVVKPKTNKILFAMTVKKTSLPLCQYNHCPLKFLFRKKNIYQTTILF